MTIVVQRRVRTGCEADFSEAMHQFVNFAIQHPGHLDINVLRSGLHDYTVVNRFDSPESRAAFVDNPEYQRRVEELRALTVTDPNMQEVGGVGGWFDLPGHPVPAKWRMVLVTSLGVYPLTSVLAPLASNLLPTWHPLLRNVLVTLAVVSGLTWAVMPLLTRLLAPFLFPKVNR